STPPFAIFPAVTAPLAILLDVTALLAILASVTALLASLALVTLPSGWSMGFAVLWLPRLVFRPLSVAGGVSYQLAVPMMARMRFASQWRSWRRLPVLPVGACAGSMVREPVSMAWILPSMRLKSGAVGASGGPQFVLGFCQSLGAVL